MATPNLTTLKKSLEKQASSGALALNADMLHNASGLNVPEGLDSLLQSALMPDASGLDFSLPILGNVDLVLSNGDQTLTVTKGTFSVLGLANTTITLIFTIDGNTLQFTITCVLDSDWNFGTSFPTVGTGITQLVGISSAYFVFSTQLIDNFKLPAIASAPKETSVIKVKPGLNFSGVSKLGDVFLVKEFMSEVAPHFTLPSIDFGGTIQPAQQNVGIQTFPALDITANIHGAGSLNLFGLLTFRAPSITFQSSNYRSPSVFFNLEILITIRKTTKLSSSVTLPDSSISVGDTGDFPKQGVIGMKNSSDAVEYINYTNKNSTTFLGCTDGSGKVVSGSTVTGYVALEVKTAIMLHSNLMRIYLSSADLHLKQVFSIIPGGSTVWGLLPTFLTSLLNDISFYAFYADFNIGSTINSLVSFQTTIGNTPGNTLKLFDVFDIKSFQVSWTCLNPTDKPQNTFTFKSNFTFHFIPSLEFAVEISTNKTISGSCKGSVSLGELVGFFNDKIGNPAANISLPFDVSLSDFQLYLDFGDTKSYSFGATANADLKLLGEELLAVKNAQITIDAVQKEKAGPPKTTVTEYTAKMHGILDLFGIDFEVTAEIGSGDDAETKVSVHMVDRTLGELLDMIVKFISRDSEAILPFPWSELNNIKMDALVLTISMKELVHEVSVTYNDDIKIGFIDITGFTLSFTKKRKTKSDPWVKATQVSLDCSFFGKSYNSDDGNAMAWDPVNGNPPAVPDKGTILDLRYLGVGQHISFSKSADTSDMQSILRTLENVAPPPTRSLVPGLPVQKSEAHPLSDLPGLEFNGSSSWFIGADFTIMGAVSLGLVFNDPQLYGLIVSLSGPKVKALAGLQFEILYRKITDNIGEYYIELKLPTVMRQIELGEVSITLPVIGVSIYTNGNFKLDFGFPWHNDFSRSCGVQVFPFVGAGGFYFGVLDGATSSQTPKVIGGSFDPVIVFGFGLRVGLGKSINEGILSATAEITVAGILQGVIGFYEPDNKNKPSAHFYKLQAVAAISGVLSGTINFVIISANVLVHIYADVRFVYESYEPIKLGLDIGVSVKVSVKVLFVHIHFSFSTHLSENFTIGSKSTPPWTLAPDSSGSSGQKAVSRGASAKRMVAKTAMAVTETESSAPHSPDFMASPAAFMALDVLNDTQTTRIAKEAKIPDPWNASGNAYFSTVPELKLNFVPTPTVLNPAESGTSNDIAVVSMLFTENNKTLKGDTHTSFDNLMVASLAWALKTGIVSGFDSLTQSTAATTSVSYAQLETLLDGLNGNTPTAGDISNFLNKNFSSVNIEPYNEGADISGTVFPMLPELTMSYGAETHDFSIYNSVYKEYVNDVNTYLQALNFLPNEVEAASFSGKESLAQMMFNDYFNLVLQGVVQTAKRALSMYKYTIASGSVSDQLNNLGVNTSSDKGATFVAFVHSNMDVQIAKGTEVKIDALPYTVKGATPTNPKSLIENLIGSTTGTAPFISELINTNLFVNDSLALGSTFAPASITFVIPDNEKTAIAALFGDGATVLTVSTPIPGAPIDSYNPYTELMVQKGTYETTTDTETLELIAYKFNTTPSLIQGMNLTALKDYSDTKVLPQNLNLKLPNIKYQVGPNTQYYIATYFGVDLDKLSIPHGGSYSPGTVVTIEGISLEIPESMDLAQLGNRYRISDVPTLIDLVKEMDIIAPGTILSAPHFTYTSKKGETPASITKSFDLDLDALVLQNLTLFYPESTVVEIPKATVDVSALMQLLFSHEGTYNFNNIAGQVSRFLLHGLRLPVPNQPAQILIDGKANPEAITGPLYELTGQQFELNDIKSVTLKNTNSTSWITFTGGGDSGEVNLTATKISKVISDLKTTDITFDFKFEEYPLYRKAALRYALQHSMNWTTPHLPTFINPSTNGSKTAHPAIWTFPEELAQKLNKIKQQGESPLELELMLGSRDKKGTNSLTTTPVEGFRWSTIIDIKIKTIESKLSPATGQLSYIYSLEGLKNEEERHVLTDLITAYKDDQGKPELYFLFNNEGGNSGVCSDLLSDPGALGDKVRIVKSNLSSILEVDHPSDVVVEAGLQSEPLTFLELLWEGALLENGGFYLQYQNAQGKGLPTSLFSDGPVTTVRLMVLCPTDVTKISSFFNSVVLESPVDLHRNVLMAKSTNLSDYQSIMKPGNLGVNVTCTEPGDSDTIQNLYSLITAQINKSDSFHKSIFALPAGPVQQPGTQDATWDFHHILPIAKMFTGPTGTATPRFPDPANSPYTAVGSTLDMSFYFQDIFGNLASSQSKEIPPPINSIGYFDELIAISNWPGVSASYDFTPGASSTIDLNAYLDFDPSRYIPTEHTTLKQCIGKAEKDSAHFQSIYYQLDGAAISVTMKTSMGNTTPPSSAIDKLKQLTGQLYAVSNTVQLLKTKTFKPAANDTLTSLAQTYHASITDFATTNKTLKNVFAPTHGKIIRPLYYTIMHGDSINSIVSDPKNHITDSALNWALTFKDRTDVLQTGTKIIITPGKKPVKYAIQKQDSFAAIVLNFSGISLSLNELINNNLDTENLFENSLQVLVSTDKVSYSTTDTIESLTEEWKVTIEQFGAANEAIKLDTSTELVVPEAFELPAPPAIEAYQLVEVSNSVTLTTLAATNSVLMHDIFVMNQGLLNVLETSTPHKIGNGEYTPDVNDTLYTLYQEAKSESISELSVDDFINDIAKENIFKSGLLILPVQHIQITSKVNSDYSAEIFEITASISINRDKFIDKTVPTDITSIKVVEEVLTAHMEHDGDKPATLKSFATKFEGAFENKVKVVIHREPSGDAGGSKHIWAAPIVESDSAPNQNTIAYNIENGTTPGTEIEYFAPAPLANKAVTQEKVEIYPYHSGTGKSTQSVKINFTKIDMDAWAKSFLDAIHLLSTSEYAVAASDLDIDSFNKIMLAKQNIASAIASSVIPIFGDTPAAPTPQLLAAQEALRESLLQNLSTAYTVDTIIQLVVDVKNSTSTEKDAVRLTGKPVLKSYPIADKDDLSSIAAHTFGQELTAAYLGNTIAHIPGLIRNFAVTTRAFVGISELTTQDSANIFYDLIQNGVLHKNGLFADGVPDNLHLNPVYEPYVAAIRPVLTKANSDQLNNKLGTVILSPTDTFKSIAEAQGVTLSAFITSIETKPILSAASLNYAWNNYKPSKTDTLDTLTDRYNVSSVENFVSANLLITGLFKPQTINFPISGRIPIVASDTFETLLAKLNLTLKDLESDTPSKDAVTLINVVGLFDDSASVGVLRAQSAINLSTAEIALTKDTSHLTFLMSKGSESNAEIGENAFIDFSYQLNGLKKESGVETLQGFEDYSNLSFVLEFENNQEISLEAPIPLRTPPTAPVITVQRADHSKATALTLDALKMWAYEIDYEQNEASQDELELKLYFNHKTASVTSGGSSTELGPLFGSLANFISNWPILEHDLDMLPPLSQKLPMDEKPAPSLAIPLKYFAGLAEEIANNWLTWHEDIANINAAITVVYTPFKCLIQEFSDENGNFAIHLYEQDGSLPENATLLPVVIDDLGDQYTPEKRTTPGQSGGSTYSFSKFTKTIGDTPLSYLKGHGFSKRHFKVENLDILRTKEVSSSLSMTRNKDLINGQTTNPFFVFVTPEVSYINGCNPFIKSSVQFDIATSFNQAGKHTLGEYLQNFFTVLLEFDTDPDKIYPITIDCQYAFAVNENVPDLTANRSVVMHQLYDFKKQDCNIANDAGFVTLLAAAISSWQSSNTTSLSQDKNAFYQFDLTVFTDETLAKPYFELSGLVLYLKDIQ
jgi:hypothetical protein